MSGTEGTRLLFKKLTGRRQRVSTWGARARGPEHRAELGREGEEAGKRMGKRRVPGRGHRKSPGPSGTGGQGGDSRREAGRRRGHDGAVSRTERRQGGLLGG